jgi:Holliday junction resolvasome RuvABC DNA-binding subunit
MTASLLDLNGVGPVTASLLEEAGFADVAAVGAADQEALAAVRGIGTVRATSLLDEARRLLGATDPPEPDAGAAKVAKWEKRAKKLKKQAKQLAKKARSTKSKKKRKRHMRAAAEAEAAAEKARRKAKKLRKG